MGKWLKFLSKDRTWKCRDCGKLSPTKEEVMSHIAEEHFDGDGSEKRGFTEEPTDD